MGSNLGSVGTAYIDLEVAKAQLKTSLEDAKKDIGGALQSIGGSLQSAGKSMSMYLTAPILGVGAAVAKVAGDYELAMNRVQALTGATGSTFDSLKAQARDLGATTQFSAAQAADGMGYLAQAGFDADQIMSAMPATLSLAAAAQIDLGQAADVASNILSGYALPAEQLESAMDRLIVVTSKSNTNFQQLGEAMKYAGPVAKSAGIEFETTAAMIGLMGNAGIQGTMAGTSLRGAITKLLNPTKEAEAAMKQLGLEVTDSSGRLLPMRDILAQLGDKTEETGAFMEIFGQRAGPAMAAAASQGVDAFDKLIDAQKNNLGVMKDLEEAYSASLPGKLKALQSAFEELLLVLADSGLMDFFKGMIESVRDVTIQISELDSRLIKAGIAIAGVAAAIGPLLVIIGTLAGSIGSIIGLFTTFGVSIGAVATGIGTMLMPAIAIMIGATGLAWLLMNIPYINTGLQKLGEWIWDLAGKIPGLSTAVNALNTAWDAVSGNSKRVADAMTEEEKRVAALNETLKKSGNEVERYNMPLEEWEKRVWAAAQANKEATGMVENLSDGLTISLVPAQQKANESTEDLGDSVEKTTEELEAEAKEIEKVKEQVAKWRDEMDKALDPAGELEKKLEALTGQFSDDEIVKVYGDEIIKVVERQKELGQQIPSLVQHLYNLAVKYQQTKTDADKLKSSTDAMASAHDKLIGFISSTTDEMSKEQAEIRRLDAEYYAWAQTIDLLPIPKITTEVGKIPAAFEASFTDAKAKTKDFGDAFGNEMSTVVTNFAQAVGDMIWEWDGFGDALIDIGKEFISAVVSLFTQQLFAPILQGINGLLSGQGFTINWGSMFGGAASGTNSSFAASGAAGAATTTGAGGLGWLGGTIASVAGIGLLGWLNTLGIQPNGKQLAGNGYPLTIEGTDITVDLSSAGLSGANWSSLMSNVPGQTISIDQLSGMGLMPSDLGLWQYSDWNDFYAAMTSSTDATEDSTDAVEDNTDAIEDSTDAVEAIKHTFEDLSTKSKSLITSLGQTGIASTQLAELFSSADIDVSSLAMLAQTALDMSQASQQFADLANSLSGLLPQLDLGISDFFETGVMSDALKSYIESLGGDVGIFEAYAGLFENIPDGQTLADFVADNADAQQVVADAMAEAASLSMSAEEIYADAVDAFSTAVDAFADIIYDTESISGFLANKIDATGYEDALGYNSMKDDFLRGNDILHEDLGDIKESINQPTTNIFQFDIRTIDAYDFRDIVVDKVIPILEDSIKLREFKIA